MKTNIKPHPIIVSENTEGRFLHDYESNPLQLPWWSCGVCVLEQRWLALS